MTKLQDDKAAPFVNFKVVRSGSTWQLQTAQNGSYLFPVSYMDEIAVFVCNNSGFQDQKIQLTIN